MSRVAPAAVLVVLGVTACATPTSPSPSVFGSPGPTLPQLSEWTETDLIATDSSVSYSTVVSWGPGFVVSGQGLGPLAWSSADGEQWTEEPLPADGRVPSHAVAWGDHVLVVGAGSFAPGCGHGFAFGSWLRPAGGDWLQAPFVPLFCEGGGGLVAAIGGVAVTVGTNAGDVQYAWLTNDGIHWAKASASFAEGGYPAGLVATRSGFMAVRVARGGLWISLSASGAQWSDAEPLPGSLDARLLGAGTLDGRLVVLLGTSDSRIARAASPDGRSWDLSLLGVPPADFPTVAFTESGLVAFGTDDRGEALWTSSDGTSWQRVDVPIGPGGSIHGVAVARGRVVVIGRKPAEGDESVAAAWVGPAELLAP